LVFKRPVFILSTFYEVVRWDELGHGDAQEFFPGRPAQKGTILTAKALVDAVPYVRAQD
jgi:hypothetical protein